MNPVYLDHHATTPLDPEVFGSMKPYLVDKFGSASGTGNAYGNDAYEAVESSRKKIADLVGAKPDEIVFTSGTTESDNLALSGAMSRYADRGDHLVTCITEHKAVLGVAERLKAQGKRVRYLRVDENGEIDMDELKSAITDDTVMVSIMAANNEIGTIPDIAGIGEATR